MGFMGAMKGMMGPAKSMGGAMGFGGGGAGPSQNQRPTGNMGSMVKSAMNPAQQMRGIGPSGPPAQRFSGMQGPNKQRSMMGPMMGPMQQAGQMNQPMMPSFTPGQMIQPPDMGSQDPSQQMRPGMEKFPGMQRPPDYMRNADDQTFGNHPPNFRSMLDQMRMAGPMPQGDPNQATDQGWGENMRRNRGLGPSMGNRGMGSPEANSDMGMGENPFRRMMY